jgi:4-amino-4-deoxy-L-arabinose transferase-like glycosyltransferase
MKPSKNNPSKAQPPSWRFWLLAGAISLYAIWGLYRVPYHPDESTYLYMSADFDALIQDPASMAWESMKQVDLRLHYRMIDAPITRYLLGLGRRIAGMSALSADWSWRASWEANQLAGALPSEQLLLAGRLAVTLLFPLSLLLIYLIGRRMGGETGGLLAALLLGSNALILLHARRAMAEGALIFGFLLALWGFLDGWRKPWLAGLGMALAFNAKQSTFILLPIGLLAVSWGQSRLPVVDQRDKIRKALVNALIYTSVFVLVTLALNPFLWRDPFQAAQAAFAERNALLQNQVADTMRLAPEKALLTTEWRAVSLLANLFILPPAFAETKQYQAATKAFEAVYQATPGHNLLRGTVGGGVMLTLTILGLVISITQLRNAAPDRFRTMILVLLTSVLQTIALIALIPLTWQRYVIPLVPLVCLWAAYGLAELVRAAQVSRKKRKELKGPSF